MIHPKAWELGLGLLTLVVSSKREWAAVVGGEGGGGVFDFQTEIFHGEFVRGRSGRA